MSKELFEKHAAPEAIQAHLDRALMKRDEAQNKADWLYGLLQHRKEQIKRGEWPGPRKK